VAGQVIDRDKLGVLTKIAQGGQGVVYRAPNVKTTFASSMVYKEYRSHTVAEIDFTALTAMPALVEDSLSYAQAERLITLAAWPCAMVEQAGTPTGFVMPAIPQEFFIALTTVKGSSTVAAEFQHLLNHPTVLQARSISLDDAQRYSLLREVASGLAFLHKHGVSVGDISPKNLLFSLTPHPAAYFIDCDAMRINGVSALPQVETPGWQVPAGEELATIYSDTYKLGLLALRLLAGDHDTTNPQLLPATTPDLLGQVITDTLTNPPQRRPLPDAWNYVLGGAIEHAQHRQKAAAPTPANTAAAPPPIPQVRSRPSTPTPPTPQVRSRSSTSTPPSTPPRSEAAPVWERSPINEGAPAVSERLPESPSPPARKRPTTVALLIGAIVVLIVALALAIGIPALTKHHPSASPQTDLKSGVSQAKVNCGGKEMLKASGSTAQANAMTRFVNAFERACSGQTLNYTANGSGAGINEFVGEQTDLGGSDVPLSDDEHTKAQQRCGSPAWDLPLVFGPIAVTYNVNGVTTLNLDGPTAAKIFNGTIATWNDPAITAFNAGTALPDLPIHVVFRSDQSGTTDHFQQYLDIASDGAWGKGHGKSFNGGVGEGAKGNDGTSAAIKNTPGSITYNEWSFAQAQKLNVARIVTSAGPEPVAISAESVGKTITGAKITGKGNDLVLDPASFYQSTQPGAYPIVLATYEIVCSKYPDSNVGTAVKAFLEATIGPGQDGLAEAGYVPIPESFKSRLSTAVNTIG
jgi:phosphate transport system substrate-binding protein